MPVACATKYPWDEWFSGDLLLLEKSTDGEKKDFDADVDSMPQRIKKAARRRHKIVQISHLDPDSKKLADSLIIRARDMTAEELGRRRSEVRRGEGRTGRGGREQIYVGEKRDLTDIPSLTLSSVARAGW